MGDNGGYLSFARANVGGLDRLWAYNWDGNEDRVGATYVVGDWTHLVWIHANGVLYFYKDAIFVGSVASAATQILTNSFQFGQMYPSYAYFTGQLDDARIYNRVITEAEITLLYSGHG